MKRFSSLSVVGALTSAVSFACLGMFVLSLQQHRSALNSEQMHQMFTASTLQSAIATVDADTTQALKTQLDDVAGKLPDSTADLLEKFRGKLEFGQRTPRQILNNLQTEVAKFAIDAQQQANIQRTRQQRQLHILLAISMLLVPMAVCSALALIATLLTQQRRAVNQALHDQLTGLPNRLLFRRRLEEVLAQPSTRDTGISVMFLDLDDFKDVNDSMGHVAGDALLCALTARLLAAIPDGVVGRLGGDEFAVLLPRGGRNTASELAAQLNSLLSEPVDLPGGQASTSVSIGIATRKRGGDDAVSLLQQADLAMYEAKASGRGSFHFFDEALSSRLQQRMALEADMRDAMGTGQFHLAYQPLISLETRKIAGFEALLRWSHPLRGNVSPATFIPVAETTGIIIPLGEFVLRQACGQAAQWPGDVKVAVNLSARQFKINLVELVREVLDETGLPPHRLELEITESVLLQDDEGLQATLHGLRDLGVRLALDDFGTGYSSLSYLQCYPFDKIKVDQSFVRSMSERPESAAIVELISALASRLGMTTTAEGIEDAELLQLVCSAGCTEGQGYHFDRPLRPEDAIARLRASAPTNPEPIGVQQ